jgi:hypothetical protein
MLYLFKGRIKLRLYNKVRCSIKTHMHPKWQNNPFYVKEKLSKNYVTVPSKTKQGPYLRRHKGNGPQKLTYEHNFRNCFVTAQNNKDEKKRERFKS